MSGLTGNERQSLADAVAREHGWGDLDGPDIFKVVARIADEREARTREAIAVGIEAERVDRAAQVSTDSAVTLLERAYNHCAAIARAGGAS